MLSFWDPLSELPTSRTLQAFTIQPEGADPNSFHVLQTSCQRNHKWRTVTIGKVTTQFATITKTPLTMIPTTSPLPVWATTTDETIVKEEHTTSIRNSTACLPM
ncbi:hypothetical protein JAAARDRAFT_40881 [Jaapia argillacea MUCL 33604]|uniref:Uncharacterized protein n=1 Tax=Jaapia argillacea MUCL 33604 TaxID=933084 RepID=A0A067PMV4_9AGAM|nr:hypothetical protein JAAARDRAFT_40881 [Jaapia argillacea MUCL 33604]